MASPLDPGKFYDRVWNTYGKLDASSPAAFHRRRIVLSLAAHYANNARHVLEVGCGQGALLKQLELELPAAVLYGSDVSSESLLRARKTGTQAQLFPLDLEASEFESVHASRLGTFDLVICSEVIEHLQDDRLALNRIARLLSAGGHLIVTVPGGPKTRFDRAIGHLRHYSRRQLAHRLRETGYTLERVIAWGFPFHNLYRLLVRTFANWQSGTTQSLLAPPAALSFGYRALGLALKPLYYLNRPYLGPQLFAVARKS